MFQSSARLRQKLTEKKDITENIGRKVLGLGGNHFLLTLQKLVCIQIFIMGKLGRIFLATIYEFCYKVIITDMIQDVELSFLAGNSEENIPNTQCFDLAGF